MLVAPVNKIEKYEERILEFKGLNKKPMIEDGEMSDMENLCSDKYPCLYPRASRSGESIAKIIYQEEVPSYPIRVESVLSKRDWINDKEDEIAAILTSPVPPLVRFAYRGRYYPEVVNLAAQIGRPLNDKSYMVGINSKVCIFPQKIFFDLGVSDADAESGKSRVGILDYTYEADFTSFDSSTHVSLQFLAGIIDQLNGELILSVNQEQYDAFKINDIVRMEGIYETYVSDGVALNWCTRDVLKSEELYLEIIDKKIADEEIYGGTAYCLYFRLKEFYFPEDSLNHSLAGQVNYIRFYSREAYEKQIRHQVISRPYIPLIIKRTCPDLDFVYEHDNRLWGVSNDTNTIYACKLGDPTNWEYYQQTSMDSYYAEQGSNGYWTGISYYQNHLLFFKEDCIVKCYGTSPSTYQLNVIKAAGVEKSSKGSLATVNGMVIYNSPVGVMAYEGDYPYNISKKIADKKLTGVVAGSDNVKYYMSVYDGTIPDGLYVLDIDNAVWHKEDGRPKEFGGERTGDVIRADEFLFHNGRLYALNNDDHILYQIHDSDDRSEIEWSATLGPFTEYLEDHKVYSKMDMRIKKSEDATLKFYIKIDEGEWEECNLGVSSTNLCYHQTIVPRRCHEFSIKIVGKGDVRIDSLRRRFRKGTEGDL